MVNENNGIPPKPPRLVTPGEWAVAGASAPPAGLALNYLIFGERAVDYGALND